MKEINVSKITEVVKNMCIDANYYLTHDVKEKIESAYKQEKWPMAKEILEKRYTMMTCSKILRFIISKIFNVYNIKMK